MQAKDIDVFDFDGTVIAANSFRVITGQFVRALVKQGQFGSLLVLAFWLGLRRLGVASHLLFKKHVVDTFEKALEDRQKQEICQAAFNENVNSRVYEKMLASKNSILSTSAPYAYISNMSFNRDIPMVCALDPNLAYPDQNNFGVGKINNLEVFHGKQSFRIVNVFTDSSDDQPLIDASIHAFMIEHDGCVRKVK